MLSLEDWIVRAKRESGPRIWFLCGSGRQLVAVGQFKSGPHRCLQKSQVITLRSDVFNLRRSRDAEWPKEMMEALAKIVPPGDIGVVCANPAALTILEDAFLAKDAKPVLETPPRWKTGYVAALRPHRGAPGRWRRVSPRAVPTRLISRSAIRVG